MHWRNHVSREDQAYIDSHHGTQHFRQLVEFAWTEAAHHGIKEMIPKEHHNNFSNAWKMTSNPSNPFHGIRQNVDEKIGTMLAELDNNYGGKGQKGLAWVDDKAHELGRHISSMFSRNNRST